jgi:hypothetical protein
MIIADLIIVDEVIPWENVIAGLANWFSVEDHQQNSACLDVFCQILDAPRQSMAQNPTTPFPATKKIHILIPSIMPHLFPLFTRADVLLRCFLLHRLVDRRAS